MKNLKKKVMLSLLLGTMVGCSFTAQAADKYIYTSGNNEVASFNAEGELPSGVYALTVQNAGTVLTVNGNTDIDVNLSATDSGNHFGVFSYKGAQLNMLGSDNKINVRRDNDKQSLFGIYVGDNCKTTWNGGVIDVKSEHTNVDPLPTAYTYADGIYVATGGTVDINGKTAITVNSDSHSWNVTGMHADGADAVINVNDDLKIDAHSNNANLVHAIEAKGGIVNINSGVTELIAHSHEGANEAGGLSAHINGIVNLAEGATVKVHTDGDKTFGVWASTNAKAVLNGDVEITETNPTGVSVGVYSLNNSEIVSTGSVHVKAEDTVAFPPNHNADSYFFGVCAFNGSKMDLNGTDTVIDIDKEFSGGSVYGINSNTNSVLNINGADVKIRLNAPNAGDGGLVKAASAVYQGAALNINGKLNADIYARNNTQTSFISAQNGNSVVNVNADAEATIDSNADVTYGVIAYVNQNDGGAQVNVNGGSLKMDIKSDKAASALVSIGAGTDVTVAETADVKAVVNAKNAYGLNAIGGKITVNGTMDVEVNSEAGKMGAGVQAVDNGTVEINGTSVIKTNAIGAYAYNGGKIDFNGAISMTNGKTALYVAGDDVAAAINMNMNGGHDVQLIGNLYASGDVENAININLDTANSFLTGASIVEGAAQVNMDLSNGAVWNVTGDSVVNELVNNSVVNMLHTNNNDDEVLEIAKLSGNGTFIMNTHLQKSFDDKHVYGAGDKIIITEASSGDHVINIRDASLDYGQPAEGYLLLVSDYSGGTATFTKGTVDHGGVFKYKAIITNENPDEEEYEHPGAGSRMARSAEPEATHWYLTGYEPIDDLDENYLSDNTKSTIDLNNTRYVNYLMDHDTLLKRLGELRMVQQNKDQDNGGIWARFRKGSMTTDTLDGDFKTYQMGYDKEITPGRRYVGAAVSHTDSNYNGSVGSADGDMTALSIYNTWLGEKSHYLDLVAKAGRMHGDSNYNNSTFAEKGSYKTMFYSLSAEYGRKNMNDNGFYYEPQAQLTLGRINGDNYVTSLGTEVQQDAVNSVLGRVGLTFGKEFNMDKPESRSNIYAKVNVLHEFAGDSKVTLTDTRGDSYTASKDYGGTWLNVGVGATANIGKSTNLYMDFEKNFGGEVKSNWIGQVGMRVSF